MVPGPAGLRGALSHVEPAQDPPVCPLFESRVPVQAEPEGRGPDSPAARLGALPAHQEHRAGPDAPGESGKEEHWRITGGEWSAITHPTTALNNSFNSPGGNKTIVKLPTCVIL